jgi:hypothetical protein
MLGRMGSIESDYVETLSGISPRRQNGSQALNKPEDSLNRAWHEFFIDRPIFAAAIAFLMVIAGAVAMLVLPISQYPPLVPRRYRSRPSSSVPVPA